MPTGTWTEEFVSAGSITGQDTYPLWVVKDDQWEFVQETGNVFVTAENNIIAYKFRMNTTVDSIKFYGTATNATVIFRVIQGGKVAENSTTVTTEEDIEIEVNTKDVGFSNGEALMAVSAKGAYVIKDIKMVSFYRTGWTEETANTASWTEETANSATWTEETVT